MARTPHKKFSSLVDKMSPEDQVEIRVRSAKLRHEMALSDLRGALDLTQQDVARALGKGQDAVSKLERRTDMFISTLRDYIEGLGGKLEITAVLGDQRVEINQFHLIAHARNKLAHVGEI